MELYDLHSSLVVIVGVSTPPLGSILERHRVMEVSEERTEMVVLLHPHHQQRRNITYSLLVVLR